MNKKKLVKYTFPFALISAMLTWDTLVLNPTEPFAIPIGVFAGINLLLWLVLAGATRS